MADGLIKKIFSFGRKQAETAAETAAPEMAAAKAAAAEEAAFAGGGKTAPLPAMAAEAEKEPAAAEKEPEAEAEKEPAAALTPFELYQAERRAIAARAAQKKREKAQSAAQAKTLRAVDEKGLLIRNARAPNASEPNARERHLAEKHNAAETDDAAGWAERLKRGMARSAQNLNHSLSAAFSKRKLDDTVLEELEDVLLQADLGTKTCLKITEALRAGRFGKNIDAEEIRAVMAEEISKVLEPCAKALELDLSHKPHIILVVGVNGSGKTTIIGKLAAKLRASGLSVMLAAGDTFRAAAIEQLHIWGERTASPVISSKLGSDAASLAFDACKQAREAGSDVLLIDTAGRLQNKTELMDELAKIIRALKKQDPSAPHTVLQSLDATTGQNALNQVEIFGQTAQVSGLVMTKLDGTARGGILVAIAAKYKLPIYFIGVGEDIADLEPFSARSFAQAIAEA